MLSASMNELVPMVLQQPPLMTDAKELLDAVEYCKYLQQLIMSQNH